MKSMLIIAAYIAVAVAGPAHRGLVAPGMPGPTPVVDDFTPIAIGPALIDDFAPVNPIEINPVNPIVVPAADGTPLVQIILNINGHAVSIEAPTPIEVPAPIEVPTVPEITLPGPINVVDNVVEQEVPQPIQIGNPILPEIVMPVEIGNPILPEIVAPESVQIAVPIIPAPAVSQPDVLN